MEYIYIYGIYIYMIPLAIRAPTLTPESLRERW